MQTVYQDWFCLCAAAHNLQELQYVDHRLFFPGLHLSVYIQVYDSVFLNYAAHHQSLILSGEIGGRMLLFLIMACNWGLS